jgi:hypothetical protein
MSRKELFVRFISTFAVTFLVVLVVTFLWNLIRYGTGMIDWKISLRLAFILAVALPLWAALRGREQRK